MNIKSLADLEKRANERGCDIAQIVLEEEMVESGKTDKEICARVKETFDVMKNAALSGLAKNSKSVSGLTGADAFKYHEYRKGDRRCVLSGICADAMMYAVSAAETNAAMGVIAAAPTAGASGILPGVMLAMQKAYDFSDDEIIRALLCASGVGMVIALRSTVSGAEGGCQAECGTGASMAAAAACALLSGTARQCIEASALAMKNCLGLACDPVAGLVEVPCVKRNGFFAVHALTAADMAMSGIESVIPPDEVIDAMYQIGVSLPSAIRETAAGGLAATPTGCALKRKIFKT